ncbi:MAG TPA: hypothetical protein VIL35_13790 [Vicinamibacterales bacterium]
MTIAGPAAATLAGGVAGFAIWCTAGSLDWVDADGTAVRVAMLPPLWLAALLTIAGAAAVRLALHGLSRVTTGRWRQPDAADADVFLPLFALAILAAPYLPWLPDVAPVWTVPAGPFAWVVWFVVGALVLRAVVLRLRTARGLTARLFPRAGLAIVLMASAAGAGATAARLAGTPLYPGGDEPHYLVIAQSLWRDGDFRIENNHQRGDTFEYFSRPLRPHYLTRGVDGEIYSVHPVALPVILAPIYALGRYPLVVVFLVLVATLAATLAWRIAARLIDRRSATFGWLACAFTAPWIYNSFAVYPEVPAGLCVLIAYSIALGAAGVGSSTALIVRLLCAGVAVALLPWFSSKYGLMAAALGCVVLLRLWWPEADADGAASPAARSIRTRVWASLAFVVPCAIGIVGLLAFFQAFWGRPSPSAPYGKFDGMALSSLAAGGPGLLFDQEYGIVAAAPVLALGLIGLAGMLSSGGRERRAGVEILAIGVALLVTVGAFRLWWGGSASVGRPIIAALLLLTVPSAWTFRSWSSRPALTAWSWMLLFASLAITVTLGWAQQGLLLVGDRDGSSRLLSWWSPAWPLTTLSPAYIVQPVPLAVFVSGVWIALGLIVLLVLRRMPASLRPGRAGLAASLAAFATVTLVGAIVAPVATGSVPGPALAERPRSTLLDEFDARRRPLALVYDPLRRVRAHEAPALVRFESQPDRLRSLSVPTLVNGARWVLPAGEYDAQVRSVRPFPAGLTLALQVGRYGPPMTVWPLEQGASTWRGSFSLRVDSNFVGFAATPELARERLSIALRPRRITSLGERLPYLDVTQVRQYGPAQVFFHDSQSYAEGDGFWTRGDGSTAVTIAADRPRTRLHFRSGAVPVTLRLRIDGRPETFTLQANQTCDVPLEGNGGTWRVEIATEGQFVPARVDRSSRDGRALGCWVAVLPPE